MLSPLPFALLTLTLLAPIIQLRYPARPSAIYFDHQIDSKDLDEVQYALRHKRITAPIDDCYKNPKDDSTRRGIPYSTIHYHYLHRDAHRSIVAVSENNYTCGGYLYVAHLDIYDIRDGHAYLKARSEKTFNSPSPFNPARLVPGALWPQLIVINQHEEFEDYHETSDRYEYSYYTQLLIMEISGQTLVNKLASQIPAGAAHEVDLDHDGTMEIVALSPDPFNAPRRFHVLKRREDGLWHGVEDSGLDRAALKFIQQMARASQASRDMRKKFNGEIRGGDFYWRADNFFYSGIYGDAYTSAHNTPFDRTKPHIFNFLERTRGARACRGERARIMRRGLEAEVDWAMLAYCAPREAARQLNLPSQRAGARWRPVEVNWARAQQRHQAAVVIVDALARRGTRRHLPALEAARDALAGLPGGAAYADAALDIMLERGAR